MIPRRATAPLTVHPLGRGTLQEVREQHRGLPGLCPPATARRPVNLAMGDAVVRRRGGGRPRVGRGDSDLAEIVRQVSRMNPNELRLLRCWVDLWTRDPDEALRVMAELPLAQ